MKDLVKETNKEIVDNSFLTTTKRTSKTYSIGNGRLPKTIEGKVEVPFNYHSFILGEAINSLVKEGKKEASKEEITNKAISLEDTKKVDKDNNPIILDLFKKPSKSTKEYIFSWWLGSLRTLGYIKA